MLGKVIHNPVRFVRLTKERNERNRYLDPDQIKTLLGSANDCLRPIIFTALHTGCDTTRLSDCVENTWTLRTGRYMCRSQRAEGDGTS